MTTITALKCCLVFSGYIWVAGIIYDFYNAWQARHKFSRIGCFCGDMVLTVGLGGGFAWLYVDLGGIFRWYIIAAVIIGGLGYYLLLHRVVFRAFSVLWRVIGKGWYYLMLPWRKLGSYIKKYYKKIKKNLKKISKNSGNPPMNVI